MSDPMTPAQAPVPVAPKPLPTGEVVDIRESLNKLVAIFGTDLTGTVRVRSIKILGKLNDELAGFDKERQALFEKYGVEEMRTIPAIPPTDIDGVITPGTPERKEPTGNKTIPAESVEEYNKAITPLLDDPSEITKESLYGKFSEEDLGAIDPKGDQAKGVELGQILYALRNLVRD